MGDVNARRTYSSPLRQQQAVATRRAVLDAARALFLANGYGATTVEQVAARAGVSKPTVFSAVGNKQALLSMVRDVAMAGDDDPVAVADRPVTAAILAEPDGYRAVQQMAAHFTALAGRYAEIEVVLRGAAATGEPGPRRLWETSEQQRLTAAGRYVRALVDKGPLREGLDVHTAVDLLWLHMAPDRYHRLVVLRGWDVSRYQEVLARTLEELLLPPRSTSADL